MFGRKDTQASPPPVELVTVFKSMDPSEVAIAESILRSAEMDFLVLGGDPEAPWTSVVGIPAYGRKVQIQVRREDEADAREMLADLQRPATSNHAGPRDDVDDGSDDDDA